MDCLLTEAADHLTEVHGVALATTKRHDKGFVISVEHRQTVLSHFLAHRRECSLEVRFECFLNAHPWLGLQLSLLVHFTVPTVLMVRLVDHGKVLVVEGGRSSNIGDANGHTLVGEPSRGEFSNAMHDLAGHLAVVVPEQVIDEPGLVATEGALADLPTQQFAITEDHPTVFRGHALPPSIEHFLLGAEINHHAGQSIRPQHRTDHLLASPQAHWLQDGGSRQVNQFISVGEPRKHCSELLSGQEGILAS